MFKIACLVSGMHNTFWTSVISFPSSLLWFGVLHLQRKSLHYDLFVLVSEMDTNCGGAVSLIFFLTNISNNFYDLGQSDSRGQWFCNQRRAQCQRKWRQAWLVISQLWQLPHPLNIAWLCEAWPCESWAQKWYFTCQYAQEQGRAQGKWVQLTSSSCTCSSMFYKDTCDIKVEGINVDRFVKSWGCHLFKKWREMTYLVGYFGRMTLSKLYKSVNKRGIISKLQKVFIDKLCSHEPICGCILGCLEWLHLYCVLLR